MHRHTPQTVVAGLTAAALGTAVMAAPADGSDGQRRSSRIVTRSGGVMRLAQF
ncbi:hypothetical protein [Dactylosporangium sp. NPDC050588]|uniref:hypothetical protein n=1 Tax=Dactylosporangium sp. NPDC050588 TaxID=3157211 RepID=UPI0034102F1F